MADPYPYLDRDIYLLGLASHTFLQASEYAWFSADKGDSFPEHVMSYFGEMATALKQLSEHLPAELAEKAEQAHKLAERAIGTMRALWMEEDHVEVIDFRDRIVGYGLPVTIWNQDTPCATDEMTALQAALADLIAGFAQPRQDLYAAGSLVSQVSFLYGSEHNRRIGDSYPVPALDRVLLKLRDGVKALRGLESGLSPRTQLRNRKRTLTQSVEHVQGLHGTILDRLEASTSDTTPDTAPKWTVDAANVRVIDILMKDPTTPQRKVAELIGCSHGLVGKTPYWQKTQKERRRLRAPRCGYVPGGIDNVASSEDNPLDNLTAKEAQEELAKLMNESMKDNASDPSPFDLESPRPPRARKKP